MTKTTNTLRIRYKRDIKGYLISLKKNHIKELHSSLNHLNPNIYTYNYQIKVHTIKKHYPQAPHNTKP